MKPSSKSTTPIRSKSILRAPSWLRLGHIPALSALVLLAGASLAPAATLYWDLNGTTANVAGPVTGNWDGATANWNTALSGTGGTPQAGTTSADDLIFSSGSVYTAGTITLSGARVASSISFEDNIDVTLSGGTSLTIGGTGAAAFDGIRVLAGNNSANAISTALVLATGTNTIQNAGTGVLTISGGITGSQNLILQNNSTNAAGITISTASLNNTGTLTNSGTGSGGVLVSAVIGTSVTSVTQNSATSRLTLSNANLFTGAVTISAGALRAANNTALGTTAGGVTVSSGAALEIDGSGGDLTIGAEALSLNGTGISSGGALRNIAGDNSWAGTITLANVTGVHRINSDSGTLTIGAGGITETGTNNNKDLTFGGAGNVTVTGNITAGGGDMRLFKDGAGTLILSGGANTYDGAVTISAGVLRASSNTALGTTAGGVTVASGAALELSGGIAIGAEAITSLNGTGIGNGGALRNISGDNSLTGAITLADVTAVHRINSDSGTLTIGAGGITETGGNNNKDLTFGGAGNVTVTGNITAGAGDMRLFKDGTGTLTLTGANTYDGTTTVSRGTVVLSGASGAIASSSGISIGTGATLQLDNTTINTNRVGTVTVTMSGGTFDFAHGTTLGDDYTETIGQLSLSSGASTISTDVSNTGASSSSILTFASLARTAGATVNFGGGSGNPSATNDNNNVRFTAQAAGLIGAWATVGGTAYATYNTASATDSVEALTAYDQTVTRLSSGTKIIANTAANNVQITDGTGSAADITLAAATTTINTLTNNATGGTSTIDPNNQTLRVGGILLPTASGALTIGNGTNNGTLAANTAGGELVLQNFSSTNALTINSVIANNTSASSLTVSGTGTTVVTNSNTYTGATRIAGGTLQVGNGGTTGSLSTSSAITTNGTLAFNRTNTVTQGTDFNSVISGTGGVTQSGSGTLVLNGVNTYSGVTKFDAGVVNVADLTNYGVAGSLGNRALSSEAITDIGLYFEGGTLQYTGSTAQSTDRFIRIGLTGGTLDASGSNSGATMTFANTTPNVDSWADPGSRTLTLTGSNTGDNTFAINLQEYNDGSGSHTSLVKSGAGTWVLTNTHNSDAQTNSYSTFGGYAGGTTISGGTLGFVNNAIGGGVIDFTGNGTLRWESGNTQDVTTGSGAGVARSVKIEDGVTATFNTNGNNVTLSNSLAVGGSGTGALTKDGAGTLTLGAANSYSGTTTVSGGTLEIGTGGALSSTSGIMINSGGTLLLGGTGANKINDSAAVTLNGGTFAIDSSATLNEQVGALSLSASSTIDFGTFAGGNTLRFSDSSAATWGAFTLSIWNWTEGADHLYFGSIFGAGLPVGGLTKIRFYSDSGITPSGGSPANFGPDDGEVAPVPEPSTVLIGLSLLSLAGYRERRWFLRCPQARRNRSA